MATYGVTIWVGYTNHDINPDDFHFTCKPSELEEIVENWREKFADVDFGIELDDGEDIEFSPFIIKMKDGVWHERVNDWDGKKRWYPWEPCH